MTLRDVGEWLSGLWDRVVTDLIIVLTNYPLDWPLWFIVTLIFVILPVYLGFLGRALNEHRRDQKNPTIWSVIGSGFGAFATTFVVIDAYTTMMTLDYIGEGDDLVMLAVSRMGYPFMAMMFVPYFIVELRLWLQLRDP